jgi:chemotaxis signal transduction protein
MTISVPQSVTPVFGTASLPTHDATGVQLLMCQCSGHGFAIRTDHLAGVYQLTPKQVELGVDRLETPQGDLPIVSLAELLSTQLNISMAVDPEDRSLLAIQVGDERVALRTGQVSRPLVVPESSFISLPAVAHPTDETKIFSSVAIVDRKAESAIDALRLVFDPAIALGLKTRDVAAVKEPATEKASLAVQPTTEANAGNASHLLIFMPEDSVDLAADFVFALPLATVAEVATSHDVFPVCMASDVLEGYVYWRGRAVPVVRLGRSFGMADQQGFDTLNGDATRSARRLVVTHTVGGQPVAFYAETSMQSVRIPIADSVAPDSLNNRPVLGAFQTEMGTLVVPDLDSILTGNTTIKA